MFSKQKTLEACKSWYNEICKEASPNLIKILLGNKDDFTMDFSPESVDEFKTQGKLSRFSFLKYL